MDIIIPDKYKNVLPHIKLTSDDIVNQIKKQKLVFNNAKSDFVEWQLNLPIFARAFYIYVYKNNSMPTQEEFFDFYLKSNAGYFNINNFSDKTMTEIKARTFKTMPSLVRDLYFNKYVSENICGYNVLYSLELDINDGIDLLLYNDKHVYGINLYTNTKRAKLCRKLKENRHELFDNVTYIEFPVEFKTSYKVGDYFLYGKHEFDNLLKLIEL